MHHIPACNLRSKYIRTIPINQVITDPVNGLKYIIEEKRLSNGSLSKVATPYFGTDEGLQLLEVDQHHLKIANPRRCNPSILMKNRIAELEDKVTLLNNQLSSSSKYEQIKNYMGDEKYHTDEKYLYTARDGIVYAAKFENASNKFSMIDIFSSNISSKLLFFIWYIDQETLTSN
jgi:hypothetical protein